MNKFEKPSAQSLRKAQRAHIEVALNERGDEYIATYKNMEVARADGNLAIDELALWKVMASSHPALKATFTKGVWTLRQGRKVVKRGEFLQALWDELLDAEDEKAEKAERRSRPARKAAKPAPVVEDEGAEEEEEEDEEEGPKSIVPAKYRAKYKPFSHTNGDDLAAQISEHITVIDDGRPRIDLQALRKFAKANDCWVDRYASLNPGQQRMCVGNRLRAKVRHGHEVVWTK